MKLILSIAVGVLTSASVCAQIFLNVDPIREEYFLSGRASGLPSAEFIPYHIQWENNQPTGNGLVNLGDVRAFDVLGQANYAFIMFLSGNGNVTGAMFFGSDDPVTLIGDSSQRYDYSSFDPIVRNQLERKAQLRELLPAVSGSGDFDITFALIPEPSTTVILVAIVGLSLVLVRFTPAAARRRGGTN